MWLKTFYFMSNFLWTVIFGICPISSLSSKAQLMTASAVHKLTEYCVQ